jgi:hypothetical protein
MLQSVSETCCNFFRGVLQAFIQNISSVLVVCCKHFYLDVAYVSRICCKSMFEIFQLFQSYVAISVLMLQVANVLSRCCICSHTCCKCMFQIFYLFQTYVAFECFMSVSCFRSTFRETLRHGPGTVERGA